MNNNITILSSSEYETREAWKKEIWTRLADGLASMDLSGDVNEFLSTVITQKERDQIINRFAAIALLREGKSYKEIGEILWLSPQTISAIKKSIRGRSSYVSRRTRHQKEFAGQAAARQEKGITAELSERLLILFEIPEPNLSIRHPRLRRALGLEKKRSHRTDLNRK
ncbi:hypothetical protein KGO95_02960 [Patescibacteria group bacterium]|nr:hypothetical protein [Patescibacteria group bacterium]